MSLDQELRGALQSRFETVWGSANISYEGAPFAPQPNVPWAEVTVLFGSGRPATMGDDHLVLHEGTLEVVLVYPGNKGTGAAEAMGNSIKEAFRASVSVPQGSAAVRFRYAERKPALLDAVSTRIPISVGWYAYDTRY